ncbi:immunity protein Imm33 domain-containing protein [Nocardia sp. NPDC003345]
MEQRRTAAGIAGQAEFTLEYRPDPVYGPGVEWLAAGLEESIREGSRYPVGETVGIGWLDCYVMDRGDGTLGLCEPDFTQVPMGLVAGTDRALEQLWFQREVAGSLGLGPELDFPNDRQYAMTCEAFGATDSVLMQRYPHGETESGWFIGCTGAVHRHTDATLRAATLYELAVVRPAIIGYLALPAGCSVVLSGGRPEIARGSTRLPSREGSLLAAMYP